MIVDELAEHGERCVCDLTELVGSDMSTVSRHLSQLKNAGIVDDEKRGTMVFYRESRREMCGSFATIKRNGALILIDDSDSRCHTGSRDNGGWWADHLTCRPNPAGEVICQGESRIGSRVDRWRVRLHRQ